MDTTIRGELLTFKKDDRSEALELDKHAAGVYKNEPLVGHVPIELSRLIFQFLKLLISIAETNGVNVEVSGKRKREISLVVPGKYVARSEFGKMARVLCDKL